MNGKDKIRQVLSQSSQYVKGVGPSRQVLLEKLGIQTVGDLITHYPRSYYDRSEMVAVGKLKPGDQSSFTATVLAVSLRKLGPRRSLLTVAAGDESGVVNLVFFNQPYLERYFSQGSGIIASGTVGLFRGQKQIVSPEYEIFSGDLTEELLHAGRIVPVYPLTAGLSQRMMRRIVKAGLDKGLTEIEENLPDGLIRPMKLPSRGKALSDIHYPPDWQSLRSAIDRLKMEEVFFLHLLVKKRRMELSGGKPRPRVGADHALMDSFLASLPFKLTSAQRRVLDEIIRDVESGRGLSRLLQGDVGSGKTIVAICAMLLAVGAGHQAALMVPTEILAQQHASKMKDYLKDLSVSVELLIGSTKPAEKKRIQDGLASGRLDMVVGTHALIQEGITFRQLGLAVIDEQHRFGVKQRARLGEGGILPHFLVMTATPIPRSLAQTVYGDLDLSVIDELPFGRRKVRTEILKADRSQDIYSRIRKGMDKGRQAFIIYPLVEETEKSDLKAAVDEFEKLQGSELRGYPVGLLHGRMSFEEKSKAIELFREGGILALVTTTVIEVGVDVPNASILLINHPERFGLAQLHQLRGRVGRSGEEGECCLLVESGISDQAWKRLSFFASTDDGFKVAEMDLKIRGPGEIWGVRQSGYPAFKLVNPLSDRALVEMSWEFTTRLLESDPELSRPENMVVSEYYRRYYEPRMGLAEIG